MISLFHPVLGKFYFLVSLNSRLIENRYLFIMSFSASTVTKQRTLNVFYGVLIVLLHFYDKRRATVTYMNCLKDKGVEVLGFESLKVF